MGPPSAASAREPDEVLSCVLKAIRNHRGMTAQQVADGMGLKKRTYERFEAGEGLLKADRIFDFSRATDSDPYALMVSVKLGSPDFAIACIDNKLVMLLVAYARDLFRKQGQGLAKLQAQMIVEALTAAFAAMNADLEKATELAESLLRDGFGGDGPK